MHIRDLMYYTNQYMAPALNASLARQGAPYGGFTFISDAAQKLQKLRVKSANRAAEFKGYLEAFAREEGFDVDAFDEWSKVVYAKERGDLAAHPLKLGGEDLCHLKQLAGDSASPIASYCHAVLALVTVAEKNGWGHEEEIDG